MKALVNAPTAVYGTNGPHDVSSGTPRATPPKTSFVDEGKPLAIALVLLTAAADVVAGAACRQA